MKSNCSKARVLQTCLINLTYWNQNTFVCITSVVNKLRATKDKPTLLNLINVTITRTRPNRLTSVFIASFPAHVL